MRGGEKDGSILIVVLLVLVAATYLIMDSGKFLRIDYEGAAGQRTLASGGSLLRSGIVVAKELLLDDIKKNGDRTDNFFDNWAKASQWYDEISSSLESGDLSGAIIPEDGKISINSFRKSEGVGKASGEIFTRLVTTLAAAHEIEAKASDYLTSIKIWLGEKDTQSDVRWYRFEEPPYSPAKGIFRSPHELLLVRWKGTEYEDRRKLLYGGNGVPGLIDFITVWGTGFINMNTAPMEVLAAVCPDSQFRKEFVEQVLAYRNNGSNSFISPWYKDIARKVGISTAKFPEKCLTVKSNVFRVSLEAKVGAGTIRSTSILQRNSAGCVVLFENIH